MNLAIYTHIYLCVCVCAHSYRPCQTGKSDGGLQIRGAREYALKVTGFTPHPLGEKKISHWRGSGMVVVGLSE